MSENENGNWYVIHTYSGHEQKVKANLEKRIASTGMEDKIFRIIVPTEERLERKKGEDKVVKKKIFPGYVLIEMEMSDDSWYVVRNTPGVTGFVSSGTKPLPLEPHEIKDILKTMGMKKKEIKIDIEPGDNVIITDGPFKDNLGVVDEVYPEQRKARILVDIFGRETPMELELSQFKKE
ncbi:MAG: transcription termination/antitermination protein NusG [Bacillota bacterium]